MLVVLSLVRCHCVTYVTGTVTVIIKEFNSLTNSLFFVVTYYVSYNCPLSFGLHCKWLWFRISHFIVCVSYFVSCNCPLFA